MHSLASFLEPYPKEQVHLPLRALEAFPPPCTEERLNKLRNDIDQNGMRRPLIAMTGSYGTIYVLAGHKRYAALSTSEDGWPRPDYVVPVTLIRQGLSGPLRARIRVLDDLDSPDLGPYTETWALYTLLELELGRYNEAFLNDGTIFTQASALLKAFASTNTQRRVRAAAQLYLPPAAAEEAIQVMLSLTTMKLQSFVSNRLPLLYIKHPDLRFALADNVFPANGPQERGKAKVTDNQQRAHLIALGAAGKGYRELNALAKAIQETHGRISPDAKLLNHANQVRELLQDVPPLHYNDHTRLDETLQTISTILTKR